MHTCTHTHTHTHARTHMHRAMQFTEGAGQKDGMMSFPYTARSGRYQTRSSKLEERQGCVRADCMIS